MDFGRKCPKSTRFLLDNGHFMLSSKCTENGALLDFCRSEPTCRENGARYGTEYGTGGVVKRRAQAHFRPLQKLYWRSKFKYLEKLNDKQCIAMYHRIFRYWEEFVRSYSGIPKFSFTVFVDIAHDNINGLYEVDDLMYSMYRRLETRVRS